MEIAHAQNKTLRVIGKLALLGVLIILLAKVIVMLLALAVVGALTCVGARAVYHRRASLKRMFFRTKEYVFRSLTSARLLGSALRRVGRAAGSLVLKAAGILLMFVLMAGTLLVYVAKTAGIGAWNFVRGARAVVSTVFVAVSRQIIRMAGAVFVQIRDHARMLFATVVEAASGALIGAMLAFILRFPTYEYPLEARVCGAAAFGAFLGLTVGISRIAWAKQGEPSRVLENRELM